MRKYAIAAVVMILLASCSMPSTRIYSLVMPEEKPLPAAAGVSVNITVSSPRYLSQSYIAYRISPYQVEISRYSRWDMAPADMVRDAFRDSLASSGVFADVKTFLAAPAGHHALDINLKRFERVDEGETSFALSLLEVRLRSPEGKELYADTMSKKVRLEDRTFPGLAKALSEALSSDISQVKSGIGKAMKGPKE